MLQTITLQAVEKLKVALDDLAIVCTLKRRTQNAYVPGQSISYSEIAVKMKAVVTKYKKEEMDGTMIQVHDVLIIVFPNPGSSVIPQLNDVIDANGVEYRVQSNNPMMAGSEIAFNQIQGRPV